MVARAVDRALQPHSKLATTMRRIGLAGGTVIRTASVIVHKSRAI